MSSLTLTQNEADALIALEKHRSEERDWEYPHSGEKVAIPLISADGKENFLLDLQRGRIALNKATYQNRARQTVVLIRLDLNGPPHRNPDDEEVLCPHIHIYREGFGDKWAEPLPQQHFTSLGDLSVTLDEFMKYCNVTIRPVIQRGLFV